MTTTKHPRVKVRRGYVEAGAFLEALIGEPLTLGSLLRAIREGEEETQLEFAAKLRISKQHLCDIEKGRKLVRPERAARWAKRLGYSPEQFVQLALQDAVNQAGLRFTVQLTTP